MHPLVEAGVTVAGLVIGLGMLSVILSRNSNTVAVGQTIFSGFGNDLGVAMSPVTGAQYQISLNYPTGSVGFGG